LYKKSLVVGILILMLGVNIGSTFAGDIDVKTMSSVGFDGNTLYVGGSGPGNFSKIQDAINNASNGDTVFVFYHNSPYYEQLYINKSIDLVGEETHKPIIDFIPRECGIFINKDNVSVSGFSIRNSKPGFNTGITIYGSNSNNVVISNNYFIHINRGIYIDGGDCNHIYGNAMLNDFFIGIEITNHSNSNIISNNWINKADYIGIKITNYCKFNTFKRNRIGYSNMGIQVEDSDENEFIFNSIYENIGYHILSIEKSYNNNFYYNDFYDDNRMNSIFSIDSDNIWKQNYWGGSRIMPRIILVRKYIGGS